MVSAIDIQRLLRAAGYYGGDLDGDLGPKSWAAVHKLLFARTKELPKGWEKLPNTRHGVMAAQLVLKHAGFEVGPIDGFAGMLTKQALTEWNMLQATGKKPAPWRPDDTPLTPETDDRPKVMVTDWGLQRDMTKRFGEAGGPQCTAGKVKVPYNMRLAWDLDSAVKTISCHEAVAISIERILTRVAETYSPEDIDDLGLDLFGGCFNFRKKRGGSTLSTHAWGVALDWDPERNQLKWNKSRARLAQSDATKWWRCWEAEGWLSLGRARDFDWMHVQAPGL